MCAFPIGSIAYLREPENGQNCGVVLSVGGGMVRLDMPDNRQVSFFYNELL